MVTHKNVFFQEENGALIDTLSATKSDLSAQLAHTESVSVVTALTLCDNL